MKEQQWEERMSTEELNKRVEEIKRDLEQVQQEVSGWSASKREDAEAVMYSPSLSSLYESPIKK